MLVRLNTRAGVGFRRHLTFNQAPQTLSPVPVNFAALSLLPNMEAVKNLPSLKTVGDVKLESLGTPPQAVLVAAPPSVPVFFRKNALLLLQANVKHVSFKARFLSPFRRLLAGNFASRYTEVVGTEPFSLLVSSGLSSWLPRLFARTTSKLFTNITLDGTSDWAVLLRNALQVFSGPSLEVSMRRVPLRVSRRFSKSLKLVTRPQTGLFSWWRPGYTFIHGRGAVGLVGNGMVYSANVGDDETVAVNRSNLVAVSVNGPHDLENCVVSYENPVLYSNVTIVPPPQAQQVKTWADFKVQLAYYYWRGYDVFRRLRGFSMQHAIGNHDFVNVVGPRTILLQSGPAHESFERRFHLPRLTPPNHVQTSPAKPIEKVPADYLNIVTVDPQKGVSIESTDDFKDALVKKKE